MTNRFEGVNFEFKAAPDGSGFFYEANGRLSPFGKPGLPKENPDLPKQIRLMKQLR